MYLSHFGLNQAPFAITPNPHFFYAGNKRGAILEALIYAVMHGEGIIKVTGEVGSGKTMLCRILDGMLPPNIEVIYLVNPTLNRDEVIYAIAGELGLATEGLRADEVIRLLQSDLIAKHVAGNQVVLLVEEAQAMPLDTLEEIRLFSNLETAHHKLLQIVLFGQPELDENLSLPRMRQLKERITHSFKVPPLAPALLPEFLMFRMRAAGYHGPDIFTKGALKLMASVSEGIIRRISILADKSLLAAFADNTHTIQAKHVRAAIEDSEFSNTPRTRRRAILLVGAILLAAVAAAGSWFALHKKPTPAAQPAVAVSPQAIRPTALIPTVGPSDAGTARPAPAVAATVAPIAAAAAAIPAAAPAEPTPALPASAARIVDPAIQQVLKVSGAWLTSQAPQHYSLQLALIENDASQLHRYLRKIQMQMDPQQIHVYPTRIGEQARFGILYGSFSSRAEAVQMQKKLAGIHDHQPQLRTMAGIKAEIKRTKSSDLLSTSQI
ncbi:AAA family ATPase [Herminiimonas sp.]|uniref:AAA family ATPase n=1 Tax=Herminiimonas sp. TaxID=1926289 RepID=UPI0027199057|nr:AAA family ATPase [Herminiimonas sp.]MDO8306432.1 AAA family ATPase [Herminiimonas sp.]